MQGIDPNLEIQQLTFEGGGFGHQAQRALGCIVGNRPRAADDSADRRHVDYRAAAGPAIGAFGNCRDRRLHPQKAAFDVDFLDPAKLLQGGFQQRLDQSDSGVVDENVEPAELFVTGTDDVGPLRLVAHVVRPEGDPADACGKPGRGLRARVQVDVADHHRRPGIRQRLRHGGANALRATRHQSHTPVQSEHPIALRYHVTINPASRLRWLCRVGQGRSIPRRTYA